MRFVVAIFLWAMVAGCACAQEPVSRDFTECDQCQAMVAIPAGRFVMGSARSEPGRFDNEGPQHIVAVKAFALAKTPVTTEEFRAFLAATGYKPKPCNTILHTSWDAAAAKGLAYSPEVTEPPDWPAVCLDWGDAQAYAAWINALVRAAHPAIRYRDGGPYRLPSEAEFEYAARAGTATARWWGAETGAGHANCNGCGSRFDNTVLAPVMAFGPNPFGLYGMLGNVWEWTADCWHKDYAGAPGEGHVWAGGDCTKHALRGGSWNNTPIFIRAAARTAGEADGGELDYSRYVGFRLARDLP